MTAVYTNSEIEAASKKRKTLLIIWLMTLVVFIALEVAMFVLHFMRVQNQLDRTLQTPLMVASIITAVIFGFFSIFYFGIKYRYTKAYCKMYNDMIKGPRDTTTGVVLEIDKTLTEKDAIKFWSIIVECPPVRRNQQNIRRLLVEKEHDLPEVTTGARITFMTHSGIMLGYELVEEKSAE